MSVVTIRVRIEHGQIIPMEGQTLPDQAKGVLTIVPEGEIAPDTGLPVGTVPPPPMTKEEADAFIDEWAGKFELRTEGVENDPKLAYLLKKYGS